MIVPEAGAGAANPGVVAARRDGGEALALGRDRLRGGQALRRRVSPSTLAAILRESSATGVLEF